MDINSIRAKLNALQTQNSRPSGEARKNVFWKPAVGKQTIRIVPSAYNKSNPFSELYFHYGIDKNPIISPTNWGEKDPIVEFAKQLRQSKDKEFWRLARKLDPKMRVFVPIIVRGEESEGVKLWGFGKEIYMELLSMVEDEDIGDYTDIYEGRDITVDTVGPDVTGTAYNKSSIRVKTKQSPLDENKETVKKWLDEQPNPTELYKRYEFDEMKRLLQEWLNPEEEVTATQTVEEDEEEVVKPVKSNYSLEPKATKTDKFDALFGDGLLLLCMVMMC